MVLKKKTTRKDPTLSKIVKAAAATDELSDYSRKKREQILQAAIESFLELGYEGATMNLVAERAGVIKQTIYGHFKDKEALFSRAIASLTIDSLEHVFANASIEQPPEVMLRRLAEAFVHRPQNSVFVKLLRTIISESGRFPELAKLFTEATVKPGTKKLTKYLSEHKDIALDDPEAFARIFIGTLAHHNMQQHILYGNKLLPFDSERLINELIRLFKSCCLRAR